MNAATLQAAKDDARRDVELFLLQRAMGAAQTVEMCSRAGRPTRFDAELQAKAEAMRDAYNTILLNLPKP